MFQAKKAKPFCRIKVITDRKRTNNYEFLKGTNYCPVVYCPVVTRLLHVTVAEIPIPSSVLPSITTVLVPPDSVRVALPLPDFFEDMDVDPLSIT